MNNFLFRSVDRCYFTYLGRYFTQSITAFSTKKVFFWPKTPSQALFDPLFALFDQNPNDVTPFGNKINSYVWRRWFSVCVRGVTLFFFLLTGSWRVCTDTVLFAAKITPRITNLNHFASKLSSERFQRHAKISAQVHNAWWTISEGKM